MQTVQAIDLAQTTLCQGAEQLIQEKVDHIINLRLNELATNLQLVLTKDERNLINIKEIIADYNKPQPIALITYVLKKVRQRRSVKKENQCMARIGLGRQCMRSRTNRSDFCKSHCNSLPYGRIDGPLEGKSIKLTKKRGRSSNETPKEYKLEDLPLERYIQGSIVTVNDTCLIQDEFGLLYQYDEVNTIVGRVTEDGIDWYN